MGDVIKLRRATPELLTTGELCTLLKISRDTLYEWREIDTAPPAFKLPNGQLRFPADELHVWLERTAGGRMKPTYQVRFWEIKTLKPDKNGKVRRRPYGVRWVTGGEEHSQWFVKKALANAFLRELNKAANRGEAFDIVTGLPESMLREANSPTMLGLAQEFLRDIWPEIAPNSRMRLVDSLAVAVQGFVDEPLDLDPRVVRRALTTVLLPPAGSGLDVQPEHDEIARWFDEHSRKVVDLAEDDGAKELGRLLVKNLNGRTAKPTTIDTRKGALVQTLSFAVDKSYIEANPLVDMNLTKFRRGIAIDPGIVVNPAQAQSLLSAVTYVRPRGKNMSWLPFFATLYYAATRPSEARSLAESNCVLPSSGWGELLLPNSLGTSNARYSDDRQIYQERSLKHRAEDDSRRVPIPPVLVRILSDHLARAGAGPDGLLFRTAKGGPLPNASYTDIWRRARPFGLPPVQVNSPLAGRPYDLRHAAVSSWIAAGVPLPEIARRAGHTVSMLTTVYAKVIYGSGDDMNKRIARFLGDDLQ